MIVVDLPVDESEPCEAMGPASMRGGDARGGFRDLTIEPRSGFAHEDRIGIGASHGPNDRGRIGSWSDVQATHQTCEMAEPMPPQDPALVRSRQLRSMDDPTTGFEKRGESFIRQAGRSLGVGSSRFITGHSVMGCLAVRCCLMRWWMAHALHCGRGSSRSNPLNLVLWIMLGAVSYLWITVRSEGMGSGARWRNPVGGNRMAKMDTERPMG